MRILFLSFAFPLPANNGHKMRTWSVMEALAAGGHDVTLLTFGHVEEAGTHDEALRQVCRQVEIIPMVLESLSSSSHYLSRLLGVGRETPHAIRRFASCEMQARIQQQLMQYTYDAILCDTVYSAINIPGTSVPIILNTHNVEHLILGRYAAVESNPLKRLYAWSEMNKLRNWERRACKQADVILACSEHDRQILASLCPGRTVSVVPNVIDTETYAPGVENNAATILFQGAMDWFPNRDAVSFFVARVLPDLRKAMPSVRFVVAGRNPSAEFVQQFREFTDIEFTGTLPDMRAAIGGASVCVVPLRIGSGTRLKILEAAALAKPIVSTRIGAEGLDFVDGEEIILVDEPGDFAHAVLGLLQDPTRRRALGLAARRRVEGEYSVPRLRAAIREALSHLSPSEHSVASTLAYRPEQAQVRS